MLSKFIKLRPSIRFLLFIPILVLSNVSHAQITPSDVYHKVSLIYAEVELIGRELKAKEMTLEPALQTNKKPVHVYAKSLELMEKVARLQKKYDITPVTVPTLPIEKITPAQVLAIVESVYVEVLRVKEKVGVTASINDIDYLENRTPSNVYENVWKVSYLLDGMMEPIKPTDVFYMTKCVQNDLKVIAQHFQTQLPDIAAAAQSGKSPKQVHIQGYLNLHELSLFEQQLEMEAFRVPVYPKSKVTPSDVYDTAKMMSAELNRIMLHLGIVNHGEAPEVTGRKRPSHVLAQMDLIDDQIQHLRTVLKNKQPF